MLYHCQYQEQLTLIVTDTFNSRMSISKINHLFFYRYVATQTEPRSGQNRGLSKLQNDLKCSACPIHAPSSRPSRFQSSSSFPERKRGKVTPRCARTENDHSTLSEGSARCLGNSLAVHSPWFVSLKLLLSNVLKDEKLYKKDGSWLPERRTLLVTAGQHPRRHARACFFAQWRTGENNAREPREGNKRWRMRSTLFFFLGSI